MMSTKEETSSLNNPMCSISCHLKLFQLMQKLIHFEKLIEFLKELEVFLFKLDLSDHNPLFQLHRIENSSPSKCHQKYKSFL